MPQKRRSRNSSQDDWNLQHTALRHHRRHDQLTQNAAARLVMALGCATAFRQFCDSYTGFQCDSVSSLRSPPWSNRHCLHSTWLTTAASLPRHRPDRRLPKETACAWYSDQRRTHINFRNRAFSLENWNNQPTDLRQSTCCFS